MAAYDEFAWFYDRYWSGEFHSKAVPILERIWLDHLPEWARLLDVCCGTGHLAGLLGVTGYRVAGIDASREMIEYARLNAPGAEFCVGDAAKVRMHGPFDGAVSTFDSLNHILTVEELEAVFRNTAAALEPGGLFAFDVLREDAYQTNWARAFSIVRDDHVLLIPDTTYDSRSRIASCPIVMFRSDGGVWRRADLEIHQRCHTTPEILGSLTGAGFGEVRCYDASALGMEGQIGKGRAFFVAKKLHAGQTAP